MKSTTTAQIQDVILDSIADGVFTVDEDWRVTTFNRAAEVITGVPREEAIGQPCCDVFRSSVCENACALNETMTTGRPIVNRAIYIVDARGGRIPISVSTAILQDGAGRVIGGVETFRDLSLVEELRKELMEKYTVADIIGRSAPMRRLFEFLPQIADSTTTVLLEGESGTGKELVARAIHHFSPRKEGRFVAVNCGALPDTLLESELFGYKAGAFTDARGDKLGRFALAHGGTLLLDEIGDISPAMQARLLRVLQEHEVEPLGSVEPEQVDVRVVAATNRDLRELVRKGEFREDLYYRINVLRIELPPLRERLEDIPLLTDHFVGRFNCTQGKDVTGVSEQAMAILMAYGYPGNVRELENIVEHAFALCRGALLEPAHLPQSVLRDVEAAGGGSVQQVWESRGTLQSMEAAHIEAVLRSHEGNRSAAAKELGINPSTLYRKMAALAIRPPKKDGRSRQG